MSDDRKMQMVIRMDIRTRKIAQIVARRRGNSSSSQMIKDIIKKLGEKYEVSDSEIAKEELFQRPARVAANA